MNNISLRIGFVGQGWIGKNYADNFEDRGHIIVRYSLESEYKNNKEKIKDCDMVFIAVPTPTINGIFDDSAIRESLKLVGKGKIAIIKSTIVPGTTELFQKENPDIFIMHSPEFLTESNARHDVDNPSRNIIGIPNKNINMLEKAEVVMSILPPSPFNKIMQAKEAEMVKYVSNCFLASKVVFFNMAHDMAEALGIDYENVRQGAISDPRIGASHTNIFYPSGHTPNKLGRGAGGHCFVKDFEEYMNLYQKIVKDEIGYKTLKHIRDKNIHLLESSNRDMDIVNKIINHEK